MYKHVPEAPCSQVDPVMSHKTFCLQLALAYVLLGPLAAIRLPGHLRSREHVKVLHPATPQDMGVFHYSMPGVVVEDRDIVVHIYVTAKIRADSSFEVSVGC